MTMMDWYYYNESGQKIGPISVLTLRELAKCDVIKRETTIENVNGRSLIAGTVKGLEFRTLPMATAVPVPSLQANADDEKLFGVKPNTYFMLIYLSLLLCPVFTVFLWFQARKKDLRINVHGKNILNVLVTYVIYGVVSAIIVSIVYGKPFYKSEGLYSFVAMLVGVTLLVCISTAIVAFRTKNGAVIPVPFMIQFFKIQRFVPTRTSVSKGGKAIASLVLGILSILTIGGLFILPIIGIVLGCFDLRSKKRHLAITGIILCATGILTYFIMISSLAILDRVQVSRTENYTYTQYSTNTMSLFDKIQTGMTYNEVVAIVGRPTVTSADSDISGFRTTIYTWQVNDSLGANFNVTFQNDKVVMKAQAGLK